MHSFDTNMYQSSVSLDGYLIIICGNPWAQLQQWPLWLEQYAADGVQAHMF